MFCLICLSRRKRRGAASARSVVSVSIDGESSSYIVSKQGLVQWRVLDPDRRYGMSEQTGRLRASTGKLSLDAPGFQEYGAQQCQRQIR